MLLTRTRLVFSSAVLLAVILPIASLIVVDGDMDSFTFVVYSTVVLDIPLGAVLVYNMPALEIVVVTSGRALCMTTDAMLVSNADVIVVAGSVRVFANVALV